MPALRFVVHSLGGRGTILLLRLLNYFLYMLCLVLEAVKEMEIPALKQMSAFLSLNRLLLSGMIVHSLTFRDSELVIVVQSVHSMRLL